MRERYSYWEKQGLSIFYQASYYPQMNRMEDQWLHLKRDELRGRVFEDELELVETQVASYKNERSKVKEKINDDTFNNKPSIVTA